jgi:histone deacetylase complex regulatory component SIN3
MADEDKKEQEDKKDEGGIQAEVEKLLAEKPDLKSYFDRFADSRVSEALKKKALTEKAKEDQIREDERRKARESKLLEEKKFEELAQLNLKKAEEAEQKLQAYERRENVNRLLDKKSVAETWFREYYHGYTGDLESMDKHIDAFREQFDAMVKTAVDKQVSERLKTNQPPDGGDKKASSKSALGTDEAKAEFISKHGLSAFLALPN